MSTFFSLWLNLARAATVFTFEIAPTYGFKTRVNSVELVVVVPARWLASWRRVPLMASIGRGGWVVRNVGLVALIAECTELLYIRTTTCTQLIVFETWAQQSRVTENDSLQSQATNQRGRSYGRIHFFTIVVLASPPPCLGLSSRGFGFGYHQVFCVWDTPGAVANGLCRGT